MEDNQYFYLNEIPDNLREDVAAVMEFALSRKVERPEHLFFVLSLTFAETVRNYEKEIGTKVAEIIPVSQHLGTSSDN
jgi:hypothetical protein